MPKTVEICLKKSRPGESLLAPVYVSYFGCPKSWHRLGSATNKTEKTFSPRLPRGDLRVTRDLGSLGEQLKAQKFGEIFEKKV